MLKTFTVYEITKVVRELIEGSATLRNIWVSGEISNFKAHSSGHCYFTLKDERAATRCVMWRSNALSLRFTPCDGMKVLARGSIGVYERDGSYQFYAEQLEPDGFGALYLAFEQLKARLEAEGLFDRNRKRLLPTFPRVIALITSPTSAAVQDLIKVLSRRWPLAAVLVIPAVVQGLEAAPSIVAALEEVKNRTEVDVVIVGRGGGSIEDLWAFNDESVARAIASCPRPIVSAVGHESDYTIADFVADCRGETPSAAAELVVPDIDEVAKRFVLQKNRLTNSLERKITRFWQQLDLLAIRLNKAAPTKRISEARIRQDALKLRHTQAMAFQLAKERGKVAEQAGRLHALSPLRVLARGFSVTRTLRGEHLYNSEQVAVGDSIITVLSQGDIVSSVTGKGARR